MYVTLEKGMIDCDLVVLIIQFVEHLALVCMITFNSIRYQNLQLSLTSPSSFTIPNHSSHWPKNSTQETMLLMLYTILSACFKIRVYCSGTIHRILTAWREVRERALTVTWVIISHVKPWIMHSAIVICVQLLV